MDHLLNYALLLSVILGMCVLIIRSKKIFSKELKCKIDERIGLYEKALDEFDAKGRNIDHTWGEIHALKSLKLRLGLDTLNTIDD